MANVDKYIYIRIIFYIHGSYDYGSYDYMDLYDLYIYVLYIYIHGSYDLCFPS